MAPNAGRGLHSFESFSFVIIALSRFISYQGRRKGKVGSPTGKTWRTSNRRNKKHKRSENYSRTHRFRRYHVEPFESCWANIGWKANFTCRIRRGDYKNMLSWSYQRGSWGSGWNPFEDSTDKGGNRHRTCSGKKMAGPSSSTSSSHGSAQTHHTEEHTATKNPNQAPVPLQHNQHASSENSGQIHQGESGSSPSTAFQTNFTTSQDGGPSSCSSVNQLPPIPPAQSSHSQSTTKPRLPKLVLPKFNGEITKFKSFWDSLTVL